MGYNNINEKIKRNGKKIEVKRSCYKKLENSCYEEKVYQHD
jgi:hypothetical protein